MAETRSLPNPTKDLVSQWLGRVSRDYLHNAGWVDVNQRFHGIALAARTYANEHFKSSPDERGAFFDGLTLGLLALGHFADIEEIRRLFEEPDQAPHQTR